LARFYVAPRGESDLADLRALLDRPENRKYAAGVTPLDVAPVYRRMASSHLRAHEPASLGELPPLVAWYARETGAYGRVDQSAADEATYRRREQVLDQVERGELGPLPPEDFRRAIDSDAPIATSDLPSTTSQSSSVSPSSGNA